MPAASFQWRMKSATASFSRAPPSTAFLKDSFDELPARDAATGCPNRNAPHWDIAMSLGRCQILIARHRRRYTRAGQRRRPPAGRTAVRHSSARGRHRSLTGSDSSDGRALLGDLCVRALLAGRAPPDPLHIRPRFGSRLTASSQRLARYARRILLVQRRSSRLASSHTSGRRNSDRRFHLPESSPSH